MFPENRIDEIQQVRLLQQLDRQVGRNRKIRALFIDPRCGGNGLIKDKSGQLFDTIVLFSNRNEIVWSDQHAFGVAPAHKRLSTNNAIGLDVKFRLERNPDFAIVNGLIQSAQQ